MPSAAEKDPSGSKLHLSELEADVRYDILGEPENEETDISQWISLGLSHDLLSSIARLGFSSPTPIQKSAIPAIIDGHDVVGKAVTGSGKTLAFGIPIFEYWLESRRKVAVKKSSTDGSGPIALILSPTRELAVQLSKHISDLTTSSLEKPRIATVTGGLSIQKQQRQLLGADIVIGTPGRLWEVINDSYGLIDKMKRVRFLVIDEADRLLREGHFKEVEEILDTLDRDVIPDQEDAETAADNRPKHDRQTLVFSATFHRGLQQKLAGKAKNNGGDLLSNQQSVEYLLTKLSFREEKPIFIDVNPNSQMAGGLKEGILECGAMEKDIYLYSVLLQNSQAKTLVFANSISSVRRLTPLLQNLDLPAAALHSTMPQKARLRSVEKFALQRMVLIATDVAARGLDIKGIDLIIHYHVPRTADMYVHRSGRTARAEHVGRSIMLCSPDEVAGVTRLMGKIHKDYDLESIQLDRQIISRLRPRLSLSQKITDAVLSKEKIGTQDDWLRNAALELGVDYDSDEFAAEGAKNSRGRGGGRSKKRKEAGTTSKAEIARMKAMLKEMLQKPVNLGVSERYLAGGKIDVDALLEGRVDRNFIGSERSGVAS